MRRLIGTVCHKSVYIRELFYYFVINIVKGNTVMYITGSDFHSQNNTVDIASGMSFVSQLLLVVTLYKQTTFGVGSADSNGFLLRFLLALFQFLFGGIIPLLFRRGGRFVTVIIVRINLKGFLTVSFTVSVYLLHEFFRIPFGGNWDF